MKPEEINAAIAEQFKVRFNNYIQTELIKECWNWQGGLNHDGYGCFYLRNGKRILAHKASWITFKGGTNNLFVLHKCDNRACVNPEHLFLGTLLDNVKDMDLKGRRKPNNGESKLTQTHIEEIKSLLGVVTQRKIAKQFNVCQATISKIANNKAVCIKI